ncbi:MAG: hypothetical protein KDD72_08375 [Anaerolineales bacterium]|nr:hypothetical protein [Anaerolineales bacterium]
MTLTSKPLSVILIVLMFGGIMFSSAMGWWATESTKEPVRFTEGEFAGMANPADIRGSYTFGDISNSFDVTPEVLAQAFGITSDDPATFALKDLETIYLDSEYEIGTASVRLFVAFYTGLPLDTTGEEIYLPQFAVHILQAKGNLTPDQSAYIDAHTAIIDRSTPAEGASANADPNPENEAENEYMIKGKTTFGDLVSWGVPKETIEIILGTSMPDPAMKVKDYALANGLDFETIKLALQAEVDKVTQ